MCRWLLINWSSFNNLQKWPFSFTVQVFTQKADKNECNYFSSVRAIFFSAVWVLKTGQLVGLMLTVAKAFVEEQKERERRKEREKERTRERRTFHEKSYIRNEKEWKMLKTMSIDWPKHIQWIASMFHHMNEKSWNFVVERKFRK